MELADPRHWAIHDPLPVGILSRVSKGKINTTHQSH